MFNDYCTHTALSALTLLCTVLNACIALWVIFHRSYLTVSSVSFLLPFSFYDSVSVISIDTMLPRLPWVSAVAMHVSVRITYYHLCLLIRPNPVPNDRNARCYSRHRPPVFLAQ
jgi:hypothetical protein